VPHALDADWECGERGAPRLAARSGRARNAAPARPSLVSLLPLISPARKAEPPPTRTHDIVTRKLPPRFAPVLFALILSGIMSLLVSGIATARAVGVTDLFLYKWITAWLFAWAVAFPGVFVLAPLVRRVVERLVARPGG
jgi:hypothetical protein